MTGEQLAGWMVKFGPSGQLKLAELLVVWDTQLTLGEALAVLGVAEAAEENDSNKADGAATAAPQPIQPIQP